MRKSTVVYLSLQYGSLKIVLALYVSYRQRHSYKSRPVLRKNCRCKNRLNVRHLVGCSTACLSDTVAFCFVKPRGGFKPSNLTEGD
jgi:hypothetical protein